MATQDTPDEEVSIDDTIANAWQEIQAERETEEPEPEVKVEEKPEEPIEPKAEVKPRDEKGKFAKVEKSAEKLVEEPTEPIVQVEAKKAPSSWRKEAQVEFDKLPPIVQDEVLKREQDMHQGIQTYKTYAEQGHAFEKALSPYMATINSFGVTPDIAAVELFKADHALRYGNPQQKIGMVHKIFQDYGISPQEFFNSLGQTPQIDPNIQALQQQVQRLTSQQTNWVSEAQQRETQALENEVSNFSAGKEHWNAVGNEVVAILPSIVAQNSDKSHQEKLQMAYDRAVWANPITRALEQTKQFDAQRAEQAKIAAEAKKIASVNVRAKGIVPPQKQAGSIEETIRETASSLGMI